MRKALWKAERIGRRAHTGPDPTRPWVARIAGLSAEYEYHREFLRAKQDWTEANHSGSRGVFFVFALTEGEYCQAYRRTSRTEGARLSARVA